jgi:hypothetical protein
MLYMQPTEFTALVFFAIAFICGMAWNVFYPQFLQRLRTHHSHVWEQLGCPKYIELRAKPMAAALRFLLGRHYLVLKDHLLVSLAARSRMALIGAVGGLALSFLFMAPVIASKP